MSADPPPDGYIHGFSTAEQARLVRQAAVLAPQVFAGLDLSHTRSLLEVGCAVGAELKILGRQWPHLHLTGLDKSASHLEAARGYLADETTRGRTRLVQGDAGAMPFPDASFDCVITVWMLEHVRDPAQIMRECLRVLRPEGRLVLTEVDNDTFGFTPDSPVISAWWDRFNRYQQAAGGDPFVGRKLAAIAAALHCRDVEARALRIISSREQPERRIEWLEYLEELLRSGAERLLQAGLVDPAMAAGLHHAFQTVKSAAGVEFQYHAVRLTCSPPAPA